MVVSTWGQGFCGFPITGVADDTHSNNSHLPFPQATGEASTCISKSDLYNIVRYNVIIFCVLMFQ